MNYALIANNFYHAPRKSLRCRFNMFQSFLVAKKKITTQRQPQPGARLCRSTQLMSAGIVDEQYIVAYKASSLDAHTATLRRISDMTQDVLQRNKISSSAMKTIFQGEPGGFIAHLSRDEMVRLKNDADIEAIEPDRIISLSTCFTVAEPRLVTWNVQRVGFGDGTGKIAWVIDTGIDFGHPDLIVDRALSKSFVAGDTSADDDNGHGTHVAGVIGAKNNTFGVMGVAAGATLVSLKVLDKDGSGNYHRSSRPWVM
jgi:hypothetical protein